MSPHAVTQDLAALRARVRRFVDEQVLPSEDALDADDAAADEVMRRLQTLAKRDGLWALGHPKEIGGAGFRFSTTF